LRLIRWLAGKNVVLVNAVVRGYVDVTEAATEGVQTVNISLINTRIEGMPVYTPRQQTRNTLH
jgi:hypothetical protein